MEASKCPKCGEEPFYIEHLEKWYCYECNTYLDQGEEHVHVENGFDREVKPVDDDHVSEVAKELSVIEADDKPKCKACGTILQELAEGKMYCFMCETYEGAGKPKEEKAENHAQALIDAASTPEPTQALAPEPPKIEAPVAPAKPETQIKMCSACGQPLKWIEKYQRHYCYGCKKYSVKDEPVPAKPEPAKPVTEGKKCPECGSDIKFIEKYSEWYCYKCRKYPLRAKKDSRKEDDAHSHAAEVHDMPCPKCGKPLKHIEKYGRDYCFECKAYAPAEKRACPACKQEMKFVSEYNEWYCYKCKKYTLRPSRPVLLM